MYVTKRALGKSYIIGTGIMLGLVLIGHLLVARSGAVPRVIAAAIPVLALIVSVTCLKRLDFGGEQIWRVAEYSAVALGVAVLVAILVNVLQAVPLSQTDTAILTPTLASVSIAGAFVGVVRELHRSNRQYSLRNAVLHRVLRHNLRNDMTVVLCLLDELEAETGRDQQETVAQIRRKVENIVDLTDKARQVNVTVNERGPPPKPVNVAALIDRRIARLTAEYPGVDVQAALPNRAFARTNGEFGLVLDNVVQSVARRNDDAELTVALTTNGKSIELRIEDPNEAIPTPDLSAIANGSETDLEHGFGMELWLVYWMVEANGGHIDVETDVGARSLTINLDRATNGLIASRLY
ncbi:MAG: ATP-binding protein [Haloarculaceae archaeon]